MSSIPIKTKQVLSHFCVCTFNFKIIKQKKKPTYVEDSVNADPKDSNK